jgi:glycosyltransferase involved in cell wall biosynthesis
LRFWRHSMPENFLSIVIGTRNRADDLDRCLRSLQSCVVPNGWLAEVIVVDNGSVDATRDRVAGFAASANNPSFRYCYEARQGKSFAVNTGLRASNGSIIGFADDDVVVDKSWMTCIIEQMQLHQDIDLLTGRVEALDGAGQSVAVTRSSKELMLDYKASLDGLILGCNMAVRREVFNKVTGRDTRLGPGRGLSCEDVDFAYRVLKAGFRGLFSPEPIVYHAPALRDRNREYLRGWGAFYFKYLLHGDRYVARKAWWEVRRIFRGMCASERTGNSGGTELREMLIGAAIMAKRMGLSLFQQQRPRSSLLTRTSSPMD